MATLIIGIGGTGTKIVRRIRKRWDERGKPRDVALAVLDARGHSPERGVIDDAIFIRSPRIDFVHEFAKVKPQITDWWPSRVTPSHAVTFTTGCGAVRANGRFWAFARAGEIRRTISNAVTQLTAKTAGLAGGGDTLEVFIVCSLGNGTGGGTFMDVAMLTKNQLSQMGIIPEVIGVFVPGSVTRWGNRGSALELKVAASGYAALVEMQYEFNRRLTTAEIAPKTPYTFEAFDHGAITIFHPAPLGAESVGEPPLDLALIIDKLDRHWQRLDYESLLNIAAEGIAMLAEGGDVAGRRLDLVVNAPAGKAFGSLGAARLMVPAKEILEYVVAAHALKVVNQALGADESRWAPLLAGPPGDAELPSDQISLKKSVEFFLEHVLHARETGPLGGGQFNQLFERFAGDSLRKKQFDALLDQLEALKDKQDILNKANQIQIFVSNQKKDLPSERKAMLLEGPDSHWGRKPVDPANPTDAGVRWLIDERVSEFVNRGAFGLLAAWLAELKTQIRVNKRSVDEYERKLWLRDPSHRDINLGTTMAEIRDLADDFFWWFKRNEIIQAVGFMHQDARKKYEFLLFESQIKAVEAFFDKMHGYVNDYATAVAACCRALHDTRLVGILEDVEEQYERALDATIEVKLGAEGVKAETYIGGDVTMRGQILAEVAQQESSSEETILGKLAKNNVELFSNVWARRKTGDLTGLIDDYRDTLASTVRKGVKDFVAQRCVVNTLLEYEAQIVLDEYFRAVHLGRDDIDDAPKRDIRARLHKLIEVASVERIEGIDWSNKNSAMATATNLYIAGKLKKTIDNATAQWPLKMGLGVAKPLVFCGVTFNHRATAVGDALAQFSTLQYSTDENQVIAQPSHLFDQRHIDIIRIELGADLTMLDMSEEVEPYRRVLRDATDFSPHTTSQYEKVGDRLLDKTGVQAGYGGVVIELGKYFGFLEDRIGNHVLLQGLPGERKGDEVILRSFAVGAKIGSSYEQTADRLDSDDENCAHMCGGLKREIYKKLKHLAQVGSVERPALGWPATGQIVADQAAALRKRAMTEPDTSKKRLWNLTADQMDQLAAELVHLEGEGVPRPLR